MARAPWSRRAPYPYDARIGGANGLGLMLISGEDGQLVAVKSKPLDAAPATYQYETQQPFLERTYVLRDLFDGMGQQAQPTGTPRRYHFAIDLDTSVNGHTMLGPLFHAETVAVGEPIKQIIVAQHEGLPTVFALAGNLVVRRVSDNSWTTSLTLGGGSQVNQAVRFRPAGLDDTRPTIIAPEVLPPASLNKAYAYRLTASGGTGPYSWGIAVGHLPAGLTLAVSTGIISGTPTAISSTAFQVRALDANRMLTAADLALRVEATAQPLGVVTIGLQEEAKLAEAYTIQLQARGGTAPYTWAVTTGTLPTGLALEAATGIISGTPTAQTSDPTPTITVRATDAVAATAFADIAIRVRLPNDDYLYLASTASNLHVYDGSVWSAAAAWAGPPDALANWVAVLGKEFWVMWGNKLAKAEANPMERDNYAGAILLGGEDGTYLTTSGGALVAFKEDGLFTVNQDGSAQNILPALIDDRVTDNGQGTAFWIDSLWIPIGNALYRMRQDGSLTPVGTEQLLENASEVRGRITCSAGHNTWCNYEGLFNPITGNSYLLKYGSWVEASNTDDEAQSVSRFRPAHHGALKKWADKQVTTMTIVTAADLGTTNDRLYAGFADGTIEWCTLPRYNPSPLTDSGTEFTDQTGYLYFPLHDASFAADTKNFRGWSVFGPALSNLLSAQISYRVDPQGGFTTLSDADLNAVTYTADGQRFDVPGATLIGRTIEFRLELSRGSASANTSPLVYGVAIHEQLRPAFVLEWMLNVDARTNVTRHDGASERRSPDTIRDALRVACASYTPTTVLLPDGAEEEMGFLDYREEMKSYDHRWGLGWDLSVRAMQYRTLSSIAQAQGLSYGSLEVYSYQELEGIL